MDKPPFACYNIRKSMYGNVVWNMLSFLPSYIFPEITDISPGFLKDKDIRLLLMDFDNTMLPYTKNSPSTELLLWIRQMKDAGIDLCIVSNSHKSRVPDFCKTYGISYVVHAAKPGTKGIYRAIEQQGAKQKHTALVGDQIYTDVLGANRAGVTSLLVRSIHNHNIWLKLRHLLEDPFIAMARKRRVQL